MFLQAKEAKKETRVRVTQKLKAEGVSINQPT
jgi:hypothetical protein